MVFEIRYASEFVMVSVMASGSAFGTVSVLHQPQQYPAQQPHQRPTQHHHRFLPNHLCLVHLPFRCASIFFG